MKAIFEWVYWKVEVGHEVVVERLNPLYKEIIVKMIDYRDAPATIEALEQWFERFNLPSDQSATHAQIEEACLVKGDPEELEKFKESYLNHVFHYNKYKSEQEDPKEIKNIIEQINVLENALSSPSPVEITWKKVSFDIEEAWLTASVPVKIVEEVLQEQEASMVQLVISDTIMPSVLQQFVDYFESKGYIHDRAMTNEEFIEMCPSDDPIDIENFKTAYTKEWIEYKPMKERFETKEHIKFKIFIINWLNWLLSK